MVLTGAASRIAGADEALGGRIRSARARRELSVAELAGRAGVSKSLVSQIERGIAAPSIDTVRRLASVLQVPVFSLFLEDPDDGMVVRRAERRVVRYRTVGDMSCTGAVESTAADIAEVIAEIAVSTITERGATRADDKLSEAAMEDRKREGYF